MEFRFLDSINDITCEHWNAIAGIDYPFTRHEFLQALENSHATNHTTGWQAQHLTVYRDEQLVAVMPLYLKFHSYGEYVFDWAWADAYRNHGLNYYPKLLSAIPFTPATGPRICIKEHEDKRSITTQICDALIKHSHATKASSVHILFPEIEQHQQLQTTPLLSRKGVQFHWFNKNFSSFNHFLEQFSSRKRKNLNKERRRVLEQGVSLERLTGNNISPAIWKQFHHFYQITYAKRSGHGGYLTESFFQQIAQLIPEQIMLVIAKKDDRIIAGALNFFDSHTLYGRYWGCIEEVDYLHFEACYYQGIEFCIEQGLQRFDPGAQGEHKIQRGFTPVYTYSNHWLKHPDFSNAVADFLQREAVEITHYQQQCLLDLPFKKQD